MTDQTLSGVGARFDAVAQTTSDGIVISDHTGHIVWWNRGAENIFGYDVDDVVGKPLTMLMPSRYQTAHKTGLARLRATGKGRVIATTTELHGQRKNGCEFPLELTLSMWHERGKPYYGGIIRDITERKRTEQLQRETDRLHAENLYLQEAVDEAQAFGDLVGQTPALRAVLEQIELVAPTDANVLILGESGTGKELVAREIHKRSARKHGPMIRVNCASIPRELYESEFFGHVKGAFTGAVKDRPGRFEAANGGTIFLDEVGAIPLDLQPILLRVIQERQYERVGDESMRTVDVRIIAATNRDLHADVDAGHFRTDLFYRLNVFPINIAPLRHRLDDIPLLATHILTCSAKTLRRPTPRLTETHVHQLQSYDWPGNIRELQNVMERALIISRHGQLRFDIPTHNRQQKNPSPIPTTEDSPAEFVIYTEDEMQQHERHNLLTALQHTKWKIYGRGGAAELLGMKPQTLFSRMQKMKLRKPTDVTLMRQTTPQGL